MRSVALPGSGVARRALPAILDSMGGGIDLTALGDGELARRVMARRPGGARAEETELCRRFAGRVRHYGRRHLGSDHAAADLAQRVMMLVLEKLRERAVREPEQIASFVLGTARLTAREIGRRARREEPLDPQLLEVDDRAPFPPDPLPRERLAGCVEALAERERAVVLLTFFEERSAADIARSLALQEGHVRVIRHRALERLRDCMGVLDEVAA